jgi:DNA-binding transcriptional regulator YiaG
MKRSITHHISAEPVAGQATFKRALPLVKFVATSADAEWVSLPDSKHDLLPASIDPLARLSADQAELVQICEALELRKQDFAAELGIGLSRLSSYLYGHTLAVPPEILQTARLLLKEHRRIPSERQRELAKPMDKLIAQWMRKLGVQTDVAVAELLGVSTMTIHRWRNNVVRPDKTALVRYAGIVDALSARVLKV